MSQAQESPKKEKKTRRRLRLSCVECTKRRQRCDRSYPCGLCVSRGVAHLCRWETVPVARPTPARPPVIPSQNAQDKIQQLSARIASLEAMVAAERRKNSTLAGSSPRSSNSLAIDFSPHGSVVSLQSPSNGNSPNSSPEPYPPDEDDDFVPATLSDSGYCSVASLSQCCVAHHGEYVGSGSLLSALRSMRPDTVPHVLHVDSSRASSLFHSQFALDEQHPTLTRLIQSLPQTSVVTSVCQVFFDEFNWRFGIPWEWFQTTCSAMWTVLRHTHSTYINPHWLSLLFGILALGSSSPSGEGAELFFSCSIAARRLAESIYLSQPSTSQSSPAQGAVLSVLAAPLLCEYLAERGQIGEAWKLAGQAVIAAEALGLHRDPDWSGWHQDSMNDDEKLLRRRAWWGIFISERMYSLIIGRPTLIRTQTDVAPPSPLCSDGTPNPFNIYQWQLIQLFDLAGELSDQCFSLNPPTSSLVYRLNRKLDKWECQLPPGLRMMETLNIPDSFHDCDLITVARQRHWLSMWHLLCGTKLHVSLLTQDKNASVFLGVWDHPLGRTRSRQFCLSYASRLIELHCNVHDALWSRDQSNMLSGIKWSFATCLSLLEGAITVASLLSQGEEATLVQRSMSVLTRVANEESSKATIARLGSEALEGLINELSHRMRITSPSLDQSFPGYHWYSATGDGVFTADYSVKGMERFPNMDLVSLFTEESKVGLLDGFET
ncbi:hypothetical protein MIND_00038100 [Mycena indigotica]|uniref:Zn(2)-C6 fungal-type domain-containing protein n=1 Tax=Mycena indigotica TaxID=2126181 RepID=A0A8H6TEI7_9AGAR|nr:uncharacterized protein MIND_00038100 [Mycena indigotica]KAF7315237.1 hypothetical protein MIND_00038100 [Mycena indigotica]